MIKRLLPILLMLVAAVLAQPGRGGGLARLSWDYELNLTTEQLGQINRLRSQYQTQRIDLSADLQKQRLELRELMQAERTNQKKIDANLAEIAERQQAMEKLWVQHRLEVRALLTDDQRVLFDARPFEAGPGIGRGYGRGLGSSDGTSPYGYGRRGGRRNR